MLRSSVAVSMLIAGMGLLPDPAISQQAPPAQDPVHIAQAQNATIGLMAGGSGSTDTRIAADIAQVVDDGDKLRVLPMLGHDSIQNIVDLIFLKGVDVSIVPTDVLTETMQRGAIPREGSVQYIAKLFQEEIHILARKDISSLSDLNGKPVSTGTSGGGTELTSATLLELCHVAPKVTHDSPSIALSRLRRSEIAAMIVIGGKPEPILQEIEPGSGLHFLSIPLNAQLVDVYLPTTLDRALYPNLIPPGPPIDTVAVGSVLITLAASSDTARAKRVNRFVDTLFERFEQFRQPGFHPKWQEVNLAAQMPGWTRYPEAQSLLRNPGESSLRTSFDSYMNQSGQSTSGMSNERREALFRDFLRWRDQRSGP